MSYGKRDCRIEERRNKMDLVLCDDLIKDILQRLPRSSLFSACLVCKRWHALLCSSSATSLSLRILSSLPSSVVATSLSSVLSHYPSLSNLTISFSYRHDEPRPADALLLAVAAAPCARHLSYLCFIPDSFLSPSTLLSSALSFPRLTSLSIASLLPLSFRWLSSLPSLKSFSLMRCYSAQDNEWLADYSADRFNDDDECANNPAGLVPLQLESLPLLRIPCDDLRLAWLWRRCSNLRSLRLWNGNSIDDSPPSPALLSCLSDLLSLKLDACSKICDHILLAADHCRSLTSLAVDRYNRPDLLRQFLRCRGAGLRIFQLGEWNDQNDDLLFTIAAISGTQIKVLRMTWCRQITVKGLRALALSPVGAGIEELALVNCRVLKREPGLLNLIVQSMQRLQKLDLSCNMKLADKEIESMLEYCSNLVDIRLPGCSTLTSSSLLSLLKHCGHHLQVVDILGCPEIQSDAIEKLVLNTYKLRLLIVEEMKLSEAAKGLLSQKRVQILTEQPVQTSAIGNIHQSNDSGWFPMSVGWI